MTNTATTTLQPYEVAPGTHVITELFPTPDGPLMISSIPSSVSVGSRLRVGSAMDGAPGSGKRGGYTGV